MRLAELQSQMCLALRADTVPADLPLMGGRDPRRRFLIHRRNYETSLIKAMMQKFPATAWLVGAADLMEAARVFVHASPPAEPCISQYGRDFPDFLSGTSLAAKLPYLRDFCELEWHLGRAAIAIDEPPVPISVLARFDPGQLAGLMLRFQSGVRYLHAGRPVDELMQIFLSESAPKSFMLTAEPVWLEIRGARGAFEIARMTADEFAFRNILARGAKVEQAARVAIEANASFDITTAFSNLFAQGLVAGWDRQE
ncbi:MAG: DNA-binding domain-containing protein [Xanthobacteraceae bacterium]|nr:DNA-binding domain-containing protein [Xanthobacteraceae bacterium]